MIRTRSQPAGTSKRPARDQGVTLIELVVAMGIMSLVMVIVTGAIVSMYHASDKVQGISNTSAQVNMAMTRLDSSVRYAEAIGSPAKSNGDWHVTYQSTSYREKDFGDTICTELRFNTGAQQLQQRRWVVGESPTGTAWVPLASDVTPTIEAGEPLAPFSVATSKGTDANGPAGQQQLRLRFSALDGSENLSTSTTTDVTFTAFNAGISDDLTGQQLHPFTCTQGGTP